MTKTTVRINDVEIETDFFDGFNWFNFNYDDEVYLDDCNETDYLVARFRYAENNKSGRVVSLFADNSISNKKFDPQKLIIEQAISGHTLLAAKYLVDFVSEQPGQRIKNIKVVRAVLMAVYDTGKEEGRNSWKLGGFDMMSN